MIDLSDFVTLSEAARVARISRTMLRLHMRQGTAPEHGRFGREVAFRLVDVQKWAATWYPAGKPRKGLKAAGTAAQPGARHGR